MHSLRPGWAACRLAALAVTAAVASACAFAAPASAKILIEIDKSAQRMVVSQDGTVLHTWPVSTGLRGHDTPAGEFKPFRMEKEHYSREWDDAPMPHSIFFTQRGHAIHGTEAVRNLGRPASHGCVRLDPQNARELFGLVKQEGMANVRVVLFGPTGPGTPAIARRAPAYEQRPPSVGRRADDDFTGSVQRRVEREQPAYVRPDPRSPNWGSSTWGPPDPYERSLRAPPPYYGPGRNGY
ncbi:MAG: L,D-transpeptidase [Alphaproteobacteria bacterium]|nr:L,D-transpeptidase [Alphaproteobacteria bacterium]